MRYGNCAVTKLLEFAQRTRLTNVGCTFKFFRHEALELILRHLTAGDSSLSPQLMLVAIRLPLRCVEIPVNYGSRVGRLKITGSFRRALMPEMRMILLIIAYRFKHIQPTGSLMVDVRY